MNTEQIKEMALAQGVEQGWSKEEEKQEFLIYGK